MMMSLWQTDDKMPNRNPDAAIWRIAAICIELKICIFASKVVEQPGRQIPVGYPDMQPT
jgi:hypothetical protein